MDVLSRLFFIPNLLLLFVVLLGSAPLSPPKDASSSSESSILVRRDFNKFESLPTRCGSDSLLLLLLFKGLDEVDDLSTGTLPVMMIGVGCAAMLLACNKSQP